MVNIATVRTADSEEEEILSFCKILVAAFILQDRHRNNTGRNELEWSRDNFAMAQCPKWLMAQATVTVMQLCQQDMCVRWNAEMQYCPRLLLSTT